MPGNRTIIDQMRDRQQRMFRIALDPARYGLTLKIISADSGIGYDSLRNYASGDTIMPITAVDALTSVVPAELLSLLFSTGYGVVRLPEGIDHDEIETAARDFLATKGQAHHPDSPGGREIADCEDATLRAKAVKLRAVA